MLINPFCFRRFHLRWRRVFIICVTMFTVMVCIQEITKYMEEKTDSLPGKSTKSSDFMKQERDISAFFEKYNNQTKKKSVKTPALPDNNELADETSFSGKVIVWYLIQDDTDLEEDKSCGPYECMFLTDTTKLKEADAIVVDGVLLSQAKSRIIPERSSPDQVWIYYSREPWSQYSSEFPYGKWNSIFNWTITYQRNSQFIVAGPEVVRNKGNYKAFWDGTMKQKTKKVLWIDNECLTDSKREVYVNELKKYIEVDIMGDCGDPSCNDDDDIKSCYEQYWFYLSFETTLCKDYVTNNFYKTFEHPIVPIVRGGANYSKLYPKNLFINTADFDSPKHLAEHLQYLMTNTTAYVEYLKQRVNFIIMQRGNSQCILCSYLYHLDQNRMSYPDLASWLGNCRQPNDLNF